MFYRGSGFLGVGWFGYHTLTSSPVSKFVSLSQSPVCRRSSLLTNNTTARRPGPLQIVQYPPPPPPPPAPDLPKCDCMPCAHSQPKNDDLLMGWSWTWLGGGGWGGSVGLEWTKVRTTPFINQSHKTRTRIAMYVSSRSFSPWVCMPRMLRRKTMVVSCFAWFTLYKLFTFVLPFHLPPPPPTSLLLPPLPGWWEKIWLNGCLIVMAQTLCVLFYAPLNGELLFGKNLQFHPLPPPPPPVRHPLLTVSNHASDGTKIRFVSELSGNKL